MESQPNSAAPEAAPRSTSGNSHSETEAVSPTDAFKEASARLGELKEYAGLFVAAKLDRIKLALRNALLYAALAIVGGIVGLGLLITAVVLLLSGLAGAIGEIFPEPYEWWAGRLIVGLLVVGGAFAGVIYGMKALTGSSRQRTVEKYENRKRAERDHYGHDVQERAREQAQRQPQQQR